MLDVMVRGVPSTQSDQQAGLHMDSCSVLSAQRSSNKTALSADCSNRSGRAPRAERGCAWLRRSLTRLLKGKVEVRLPRTWGGVFRNDYDHRDFCAIGASAGAQRSCPVPAQSCALERASQAPAHCQQLTSCRCSLHQSRNYSASSLTLHILGCEARAVLAGVAVAFNGPISGMAFIAEESAANLGGPVYYRALMSNCVALLVFNILVAAYNDQGYFWNSR